LASSRLLKNLWKCHPEVAPILRDRRICFIFSVRKQQILRSAQDDNLGEEFFSSLLAKRWSDRTSGVSNLAVVESPSAQTRVRPEFDKLWFQRNHPAYRDSTTAVLHKGLGNSARGAFDFDFRPCNTPSGATHPSDFRSNA
jgi:hypothetical protein